MAKLATIRDEAIAAQINKNALAMPNQATAISYFSNFYHKPREGDNAAATLATMMNEDPTILRQTATPLVEQHTNTMAAEVAADRVGVYTAVSTEYAVAVADQHIGNAEYKAGKEASRTGSRTGAALIALLPGKPIFAGAVRTASLSAIQKGLEDELTRTRNQEFVTNNLIKADGTYNKAGLASYDAAKTGALPADEREASDIGVGFRYAKEQDATHFQ